MVPFPRLTRPRIESTAFLLCDIQEKFRRVLQNPAKIDASKILGIPLIVTEQNPEKLGKTVIELDISSASLVDHKMSFSMMTANVQRFLENRPHIKSVVLFGIEAHVCIYQTALDLLQKDFQVFMVADGIDSQDQKQVPTSLDQLRSFGAVVGTSDGILFQLLETAEHPKFRQISSLVKTHSKL